MDFVRFLIHEDLCACLAWCFRYSICSAWFLDIRILTFSINNDSGTKCLLKLLILSALDGL